eukprot:TRINITY_DN12834_c0_g1_i1.p1 TRINITY_DN12834_c0_g1~~TRINITY_DN12834_c0_g1_i1.p1  ORF type:complete len:556 (+),score=89.62 TRINITY_DN12834_c0_g1_i1:63-1730(+)
MAIRPSVALCLVVASRFGALAVPWNDGSISVGCFLWGWWNPGATELQDSGIDTVPKCKAACHSNSTCKGWSLNSVTSRCYLGSQPFGVGLEEAASPGDISGPPVCTFPAPACSLELNGTFPGRTGPESFASWPTGFEPQPGQCLEKKSDAHYVLCPEIKVLEEHDAVKHCLGLVPETLFGKTCKEACEADMYCAVWTVTDTQCFHGNGENCVTGNTMSNDGRRIMHGDYRVLKKFDTAIVKPLKKVFDATDATVLIDATSSCRNVCLSMIDCQYWQLRKSGCWVEDIAGYANDETYPLIQSMLQDPVSPDVVIDGEFIQHYCQSQMNVNPSSSVDHSNQSPANGGNSGEGNGETTVQSAGTASVSSEKKSHGSSDSSGSDSSAWPWWTWLLLALLLLSLLLCLAAAVYFAMGWGGKKAPKKKRGRRPEAVQEFVGTDSTARSLMVPQEQLTMVPQQEVRPVFTVPQAQPTYMIQEQVPVPTAMVPVPTYQPAPVQQYVEPMQQYAMPAAPMQQNAMQPGVATPNAPYGQSIFDMVDANHDGFVTRDEFRQAMLLR